MTTPPKAKKTPRNQPIKFDETLTLKIPEQPTLPYLAQVSNAVKPARFTLRQIKIGLWAIWMLAAIFAGIGVGRLILNGRKSAEVTVAAAPVATANLKVVTMKNPEITAALPVSRPGLTVGTSNAIAQAQAGTPASTVGVAALQPAASSDAQQPGFDRLSRIQGNAGVPAIR